VRIKLLDHERKMIAPIQDCGTVGRANIACPACGATPLDVTGPARKIAEDDRAYEATAITECCKVSIGIIRAEPATLFGVREDEATLTFARCRIYDGT
jgi:hypothetical protein